MIDPCSSGEELGRTRGGAGRVGDEMEVAIKVLKMQGRMAGVKKPTCPV